jgi:hypothetical protein
VNAIVLVLIAVSTLTAGAVAVLAVVIAGIHGDERHMSLARRPHSRAGIFARRVLGVHTAPPVQAPRIPDNARR